MTNRGGSMTSSVVHKMADCTEGSSTMERSAKKKRICGKYCVAGGPGHLSCKNNSLTEGISMHTFPSSEVLRSQWTKFVRKHRQCFKPSKTSVLCSMHFKPECFTRRLDLTADVIELTASRRLVQGSIPTIDCAAKPVVYSVTCTQNLTDRNRRKVSLRFSDHVDITYVLSGSFFKLKYLKFRFWEMSCDYRVTT